MQILDLSRYADKVKLQKGTPTKLTHNQLRGMLRWMISKIYSNYKVEDAPEEDDLSVKVVNYFPDEPYPDRYFTISEEGIISDSIWLL